jgi:hypothetical protein
MKLREQHNRTEKAMSSIEGLMRAEASPFLYGKIMEQLRQVPAPVYYTGRVILRFAMAILLLATLNAAIIRTFHRPVAGNEEQLMQGLAQEYFGAESITSNMYQ